MLRSPIRWPPELVSGEVSVRSEPGQGAEFTVRLPLQPA